MTTGTRANEGTTDPGEPEITPTALQARHTMDPGRRQVIS